MEGSDESIDAIMKQIKEFTERNDLSSSDTPVDDQPAIPPEITASSSTDSKPPTDSDLTSDQSFDLDSESVPAATDKDDTEVPFFLLKVGKICGKDFETLDDVAREMKSLKYAPSADDSDIANFLKEFNLRFSVAADTLEEVLDLMEVIQNTGVPMQKEECEMCAIQHDKTSVYEQQNRELVEQNHELKCEVETLKRKITEMESAAMCARVDSYGSDDKVTALKHELAKSEAQVKCLKSRVDVLTQGKANAEKAYIGLEELLNTQISETTRLSQQREDLVALLRRQNEICQNYEQFSNERALPVVPVKKSAAPQIKVVEKVIKPDYVELLVRVCQQVNDRLPNYVVQEVHRIKDTSAPADNRIITIIQFLIDYCLDIQKRADDAAKETKGADGEVKAAQKTTQRILRAFENELRFLQKLVTSNDLQDVVFFRPNTGTSLVLDTESKKELIRHSVLVSKFIEENVGSYTREQVENLATVSGEIDVDNVIGIMESHSFEEHVRSLIEVIEKSENINNEFLYDIFFAQAIMNEVLQKHAQSLQLQVSYVTHENQKLQSELSTLDETSAAMEDAGKVIKKLQRREKKLRRELERRIQKEEEEADPVVVDQPPREEVVVPSSHKHRDDPEDILDGYEAQIRELRSERAKFVQIENTYKATIGNMTSEMKKKEEEIAAIREDFNNKAENWKEKLLMVKNSLQVLKEDREALRQSFEELERVHQVEVGNFATKVKAFDDKVKLIEREFQAEKAEKDELKSENATLSQNLQTIQQEFQCQIDKLKNRVIVLQNQYETTLKECQKLRQTNEELAISREDSAQKVQELQSELESVTIMKRAVEMKLRTDAERFENEKRTLSSQLTAKMTAVKNEFQELLDKQEEKHSEQIHAILEASQDYNDSTTDPVSIVATLRSRLKELEEKQDLYLSVLEDYAAIKDALGNGAQTSSISAIRRIQDELTLEHAENERLKNTITELNNSIENQQRECRLAKTDVASTQTWERWARRIYSVMNESNIATLSSDQLRTALEEAVFAAIGQRSILFKMFVLREEKKAFVKFSKQILTDKSRFMSSLRPIILVCSAVKRLQARAGCLPLVVGSKIPAPRDESKHLTLTLKNRKPRKPSHAKAPLRPMVPLLL